MEIEEVKKVLLKALWGYEQKTVELRKTAENSSSAEYRKYQRELLSAVAVQKQTVIEIAAAFGLKAEWQARESCWTIK